MVTTNSRGKICAFVLLSIYIIAGVTILSTVTSPNQGGKGRKHFDSGKSKIYDFNPLLRKTARRPKMKWCQPLKFLNDVNRPIIALVSFPGSGNTWVRYLIQQATGIHTGSVYKDFGLLKNGFPGEYIADSSVIVVKTHEKGPAAHRGYKKAVLLIRDPMQAIQAEFNRQGGGHVGFASPDRYKIGKGKFWEKFVQEQIIKWRDTNLDWFFNFTKPTMILFYDQLISDLESNLRRLLKFLEVNVTESQLQCAIQRKEGIYKRKKKMIHLDPFTKDMKTKIEATKLEVYKLIYDYISSKKRKKIFNR
ncbi:conserved hypothetical protein [Pediculus humanus corporis]|uniref:Sulfotransferase domain-containing protein n=1 Tax=Pediculus humanus subsp. corporis TaxID=121224 RepID=E0W3N7_PEDHC|nr:uncharacterized protein Phum_PHUM607670 [Pediculus humanus corporis]EEB20243.1 conserved hypothetical protein [Pediculus humanus corporis]